VGLSQYGAYGLALKGWKHGRILQHYYTGTTVGRVPASYPDSLRIGLTWDRGRIHLKAVGGPVRLRLGSPTHSDMYTIPQGYAWTVRATSTGKFRLINAKGDVVNTVGGPRWHLYAVYEPTGARVYIPEAGHTYSRGYVELNVYHPCGSCSTWFVRAVAVVTPQEYVYGIGEVPSSWPLQAMEAQAVAARSYGLAHSGNQHRSDHGACNCALYPSTVDQVYAGWDKEAQGPGWIRAVQATAGEVVLYKGTVITAVYSSSSGGYSEANENSWFNSPIPYLRSVCDPGDYTSANPNRTWSAQLTGAQIGYRLSRYGYSIGTVTGFDQAVRSRNSGRIVYITVHGTGGADGKSVRVSGPVLSGTLGLRDDKVWINVNRNVTGPIRARYDGLMCAPGRSASRRYSIENGQLQRFTDGALYIAPGRSRAAWSHGAIYRKFVNFGGVRSVLGYPVSDVLRMTAPAGCGSGGCAKEVFAHGNIYVKGSIGAHELHGVVLTYYLMHQGAGGPLGFPTSDVKRAPGGGRTATFEHGTVTCTSSTSCSQS
jgi:SpoIID/LytB domain protein